ncbi:IS5 family transposase [Sinimarinibacterium flocculans]|uniref:IS5 family transposase n=1 Tax=Sinimarinibacterium flocculans TaxID=985250 RepID=UPI003511852F
MRGADMGQVEMLVAFSLEDRVPADHPLRTIRRLADGALREMRSVLTTMYSHTGRPSIPPERLIRALLLQVLFSIRSERQLVEQLHYNLLYRWFVGMGIEEQVWDATTFTRNRQRLIDADAGRALMGAILSQARRQKLLSDEHFSVDGTLIEAWASHKSFQSKDDDPPAGGAGDFRGQRRTNDTHASITDPQARSYRKAPGQEARLAYLGHALMDSRHGLVVDGCATQATGTAERDAAGQMIDRIKRAAELTLAADKGYDAQAFVEHLTRARVRPHIAQNTANRRSAVPDAIACSPGYAKSISARRKIEDIFGWLKRVGGLRKVKLRGVAKVDSLFTFALAAYNLVRMRTLLMPQPQSV